MSGDLQNSGNILKNFPNCLRNNIEELCLRSKIGLTEISLNDISVIPNNNFDGDNDNFHFLIKVPYAGKRLKWEIFFDPEDFNFAPDFDFNDDHFLLNPDIGIIKNNIPSLVTWNLKNPKVLTQVLNEFLLLYKKHQIDKLKQENIHSFYYEEYESLINGDSGIDPEDIEVQVEANIVHFLISIKIDCSALPKYIQPLLFREQVDSWFNPGEDFVHLKISMMKMDGNRSNALIYLSPRLDQLFSGKGLQLPEYKKDIPLQQYIAMVTTTLKNKIAFIVEHYKMKRVFISTLVAMCNRSIVEYDTESFNKAVFLHTVKNYDCLISVLIGPKFPQESPTVTLCSVYCQEGKNCIENFDKYPYNMNDEPEENITMLLKALDQAILNFKNHRH